MSVLTGGAAEAETSTDKDYVFTSLKHDGRERSYRTTVMRLHSSEPDCGCLQPAAKSPQICLSDRLVVQ